MKQSRHGHNYALYALLVLVLLLSACNVDQTSGAEIEQAWQTSAHADAASRSFTSWDNNDPPEISGSCAKRHSTTGYLDFLGLDGSPPGQVDTPAPVGTTVECEACHNNATGQKQSAVMPSGIELTELGENANCMDCHQGRQSTVSINEAVAGLDDDTVSEDLRFLNIHNTAAGPTQYGTEAKGGYEYEQQAYFGRYEHVVEFKTCIDCHDAHTLKVSAQTCNACHVNAVDSANFKNIRVSNVDYDGDGDITEGIAGEIETMRDRLLLATRIYAARTKGLDNIVYEDRNPYFFDEAGDNYATWTPRLLRAAYNYQYAKKDHGGYTHNGQYTLQLLFDSLSDLGVNTSAMTRPEAN